MNTSLCGYIWAIKSYLNYMGGKGHAPNHLLLVILNYYLVSRDKIVVKRGDSKIANGPCNGMTAPANQQMADMDETCAIEELYQSIDKGSHANSISVSHLLFCRHSPSIEGSGRRIAFRGQHERETDKGIIDSLNLGPQDSTPSFPEQVSFLR